ncbi:sugar transferase [Desulfovibrio ferrophilus]|uniref:Sugar transferases involved in lipopolysaccharide synthesis n=1 Tax=Desulfovibrio ferrophilus TaxID=241368 RepID=A0A2Z6B181_9BACT|nr:sugar transferase [Desulfovibrio ferrophilus]BBD09261.1 sugar transferases involved in lipopolysaccharide synthesis [Desulfovibrio ferrophilus]
MYRKEMQILVGAMMGVEALLAPLACYTTWVILHVLDLMGSSLGSTRVAGLMLLMVFINNQLLLKVGLYSSRWPGSLWAMVEKITMALGLGMVVTLGGLFVLGWGDMPRLFVVGTYLLAFAFIVAFRVTLDVYLGRRKRLDRHCRRVLVVGAGRKADLVCKELSAQRSMGHRIIGFLTTEKDCIHCIYGYPYLGDLRDMEEMLTRESVDEVLFVPSRDDSTDIEPYLEMCETMGKDYMIVPYMYEPAAKKPLRGENIQSIPVLVKHMAIPNPSGAMYKRIMDYLVGIPGLLVFILMYPFVALAIRWDSPGPTLFRQERVGRNGRIFGIYKFRTMVQDSEGIKGQLAEGNTMSGPIFKLDDDPRITRVGRFLRRTSLDEFPQFMNVIKGDMSVVGPRPPTPDEVDQYRLDHYRRLSFRPGITGLWQVSGRSEIKDFERIVELDLEYIDKWRFMRDVRILLETVFVVLRGNGAQ